MEKMAGGCLSALRDLKNCVTKPIKALIFEHSLPPRAIKQEPGLRIKSEEGAEDDLVAPTYMQLGVVEMTEWFVPPAPNRLDPNRRWKARVNVYKKGVLKWLEQMETREVLKEEKRKQEGDF